MFVKKIINFVFIKKKQSYLFLFKCLTTDVFFLKDKLLKIMKKDEPVCRVFPPTVLEWRANKKKVHILVIVKGFFLLGQITETLWFVIDDCICYISLELYLSFSSFSLHL